MKAILFLSIFIINPLFTSARKFIIDDIPLKWKDFTVKEGFRNHPFDAKIWTQILYRFEIKDKGSVRSLLIYTEVKIDPIKSWVKKEFISLSDSKKKEQLLNHEKGHLIIALIQHRKLQKLLSTTKFSTNPRKEIDSLHKVVLRDLEEENNQYDLETNHMNNQLKQAEWIDTLLLELNNLYVNDNDIRFKNELQITIN